MKRIERLDALVKKKYGKNNGRPCLAFIMKDYYESEGLYTAFVDIDNGGTQDLERIEEHRLPTLEAAEQWVSGILSRYRAADDITTIIDDLDDDTTPVVVLDF